MSKIDRYIFFQLIGPFGFFALVLTGILWLNQALKIIDIVISSGQSSLVFLEFSGLLLPQVMTIVLPVSALSAALFVTNRLFTESELVVMQAAGIGPIRMLKPFFIFGIFAFILLMIIAHILTPMSIARLENRKNDLTTDIATSIIVEGNFIHPATGTTIYINNASTKGEMSGVFLNDQRIPTQQVTYSARKALMVKDDDEARIIMFDGLIQRFNAETTQIQTIKFDQFAYNLSGFIKIDADAKNQKPAMLPTSLLLSANPDINDTGKYTLGAYRVVGHSRFVRALFCLLLPVMGASIMMTGTFRRSGFTLRIIIAVVATIALFSIMGSVNAEIIKNPTLEIIAYVPILLTVVIIFASFIGAYIRRNYFDRSSLLVGSP